MNIFPLIRLIAPIDRFEEVRLFRSLTWGFSVGSISGTAGLFVWNSQREASSACQDARQWTVSIGISTTTFHPSSTHYFPFHPSSILFLFNRSNSTSNSTLTFDVELERRWTLSLGGRKTCWSERKIVWYANGLSKVPTRDFREKHTRSELATHKSQLVKVFRQHCNLCIV